MHRCDRIVTVGGRRLESKGALDILQHCGGRLLQMPTVRSPCTFEWPRNGHMPAPGLPMLPRNSSRLAICWTFEVPERCWVTPMP